MLILEQHPDSHSHSSLSQRLIVFVVALCLRIDVFDVTRFVGRKPLGLIASLGMPEAWVGR